MKLTLMAARVDSSGRHNDRNFDVSKAKHIDASRISQNQYYTYNGDLTRSFTDIELQYYKDHFEEAVKQQNKKNVKARHKERNNTILRYYRADRTRPEDLLIQVGDKNKHITPEQLWAIAEDYQRAFDERYGQNCKILTMAMHADEATPHIHIRRVWSYTDQEDGIERVSQTRALENLGITAEDPGGEYRFNNAKISFTQQDRELLFQICREHNIALDNERTVRRPHLSIPEYKAAKDEIAELELTKDGLAAEVNQLRLDAEKYQTLISDLEQSTGDTEKDVAKLEDTLLALNNSSYNEAIRRARERTLKARLYIIAELYKREFSALQYEKNIAEATGPDREQSQMKKLQHKIEAMEKFLEQEGLLKKYKSSSRKEQAR